MEYLCEVCAIVSQELSFKLTPRSGVLIEKQYYRSQLYSLSVYMSLLLEAQSKLSSNSGV